MVSDGIQPSNEKRGYVLRRLIRRAFRHGKLLGIEGEFLSSVINNVIESYKAEYDELVDRKDKIINIIKKEEANFQNTIDSGLDILNDYIKDLKENNEDTLNRNSFWSLFPHYSLKT